MKKTIRARLVRPVENRHLRRLRKMMKWSLNQFARAFNQNGCRMSRSYAKKLLRHHNPFKVSAPVTTRYRELRADINGAGTPTQEKTITILASWDIADGAEIFSPQRPILCKGHRKPMFKKTWNNVFCSRGKIGECQKLWRLKSGKHAHRRRAGRVHHQHHHSTRHSANARHVRSKQPTSLANQRPRSKGK